MKQKEKPFALVPIAGTKNRVFIKPIYSEDVEGKTETGLIIPKPSLSKAFSWQNPEDEGKAEKEPAKEGIVIAVSEFDESGMKPNTVIGDYVYFDPYAAKLHDYNGTPYLVIKEGNIHAKLAK